MEKEKMVEFNKELSALLEKYSVVLKVDHILKVEPVVKETEVIHKDVSENIDETK